MGVPLLRLVVGTAIIAGPAVETTLRNKILDRAFAPPETF